MVSGQEYRVSIDARGRVITGICAMSQEADGSIIGTIVNEFGVKAFDFSFDGKKAKLHNVFQPINKWYIKKVVRKDIAFLLRNINAKEDKHEGKRSISFSDDGEITLTNHRYKINYTFNRLNDDQ